MTRTMMLLVPAILIVPLATDLVTVQPSRAEPAVNECKTKPDSSAPAGSHWYYRVNRADQRHCWYLGAEGVKVRSQAREGASRIRALASSSRRCSGTPVGWGDLQARSPTCSILSPRPTSGGAVAHKAKEEGEPYGRTSGENRS